ncbi:MAG: DUF5799 family protein [Halovenus sp.]
MANDWTERLAGARMQVDRRFNDRVLDSRFTNQEWGLIMTAVEFDIDNPEHPGQAQLVAKTDHLEDIIGELDSIQREMGGSPTSVDGGPAGNNIFGRLRQYLAGLKTNSGGGNDREKLLAASKLVEEYATELQQFLKEQGRWEDICERAAREPSGPTS